MKNEYEKEIEFLKKRGERERKARLAAEQLLDDYAKKVYLSNEQLRDVLASANKRQTELEFFIQSSAESLRADSESALIDSLLKLCAKLTRAVYAGAMFFDIDNDKTTTNIIENSIERDDELRLRELIPSDSTTLLSFWSIQEVVCYPKQKNSLWLLCSNFNSGNGQRGWVVLAIESKTIDEQLLYILDTHIEQLRQGLDRINQKEAKYAAELEYNQLRTALSDAKKKLNMADRMSTLGVLASGVAHEINNPLAFISANNRYLKKILMPAIEEIENALHIPDCDDIELLAGAIEKVRNATLLSAKETLMEMINDNEDGITRLSKISESLRTFSHAGDKKFQDVDVNDVVKQSLKVASLGKDKPDNLTVQYNNLIPLVKGDKYELEQVVLNLIVNALHATKEKGTVNIKVFEHNEMVCMDITDSGTGINSSDLANIFSPFFTTKNVGEGTGLGLSLSKNIVEAHGGELHVSSEPNVGTQFVMSLPKVLIKKEVRAAS